MEYTTQFELYNKLLPVFKTKNRYYPIPDGIISIRGEIATINITLLNINV